MWKLRDGKWRQINLKFIEQEKRALLLSATIRAIYDKDAQLTPQEQQDFIQSCIPHITAAEMEAIIPTTGPTLAATIRAVIGIHRATNRSERDTGIIQPH